MKEHEWEIRWSDRLNTDVPAIDEQHRQFIAQFGLAMKEFEQADVSFTWAVKGLYIKQLMVDHLLKDDMKYRDFLRKIKGSKRSQNGGSRIRKLALAPHSMGDLT